MNGMKYIVKKYLPRQFTLRLGYCHAILHYICTGKTKRLPHRLRWTRARKKEIYYVHQVSCGEIGILSLYRSRLLRMAKKAAKGYQVIVDYEEPSNTDYETVGMHNLWEDTFEQPCRKRAKEVNSKKNVIIEGNLANSADGVLIKVGRNPEYYRRWKKLADRIFPIKKSLQEEFEIYFKEKFKGKKVLGVSLREEFRVMKKLHSAWSEEHPGEPSIEECIKITAEKMDEFAYDYLYVTTQYEDTIKRFKKVFGDKLLYVKRNRASGISEQHKNLILAAQAAETITDAHVRENWDQFGGDRKEIQNNYIKEIYGLSKCESLLGTASGGMAVALIWNGGKYRDVALFDRSSVKMTSY